MAIRCHYGWIGRVAGVSTCFIVMALVASGHSFAQEQAQEQDLQGILPEYVPAGLSEGDFNQLDGNWAAWSNETGRLVTDFYTSNDDQVRGRRQTLELIISRLETMDRALADASYLPLYGPLADLHGRLSRRIAIAGALLHTMEQDMTASTPGRLNSAMSQLAAEADSLRIYLQSINGGGAWIDFLQLTQVMDLARRGADSPDALDLISAVGERLADRTQYSAEQQEFLDREPLRRFAVSVDRVAEVIQIGDPEDRRQQLRELAAQLLETLEEYENQPTAENMRQLRNGFDRFRRLAPDGGVALTAAMRKHYLNYNLRVVVAESLAQDLVRDSQVESGYINEMVSSARITGCQWTNATVNLDLKPGYDGARFDLILDGNVRSSITGSTHFATVQTAGQYYFHGRKHVLFDGDHFTTWPAQVSVSGGNRPYAARTKLNWVPIVRRIARNAALREAGSAENNQYARNKVYQQARSEFDRETAQMLRDAEYRLENEVAGPLRDGGYFPDVKQFSSTETELMMRSRLMESGELGGSDALPLPIYPAHGALVQIHESLLNQVGVRLDLEGKRFTPEQLEQYLRAELEQLTGRPTEFSGLTDAEGTSPKVEEIIFHDTDAVRFRVTGGEVILYLNLGLKLEDREEIAPQQITVPLQFSLAGNAIHMERGTVGVRPIGPVDPRDRTQQIVRAGVMRQKIQEAFEPQDFDASFNLSLQQKEVTLFVTDLRARSGWLSLIAVDGVSQPYPSQGPIRQVQVSHAPHHR